MIARLFSSPILLTVLAMLAFTGNSLLCRIALKHTEIDAASFNTIRLISGAVTLWFILIWQSQGKLNLSLKPSNLMPALSLFVYGAGFAFAYIELSAATGALLLFGSVQLTMIAYALYSGERLTVRQAFGLAIAVTGVAVLLLPHATSPTYFEAGLMIIAGIAWGAYSLLGKKASSATKTAAQSFILSVPLTLILSLMFIDQLSLDTQGVTYALISGAVTSGLGYAIWYQVLPKLTATVAASVQLSVPALTAIGGAMTLAEPITLELILITTAILGGIALVTFGKKT